jgi:hypothetical protein
MSIQRPTIGHRGGVPLRSYSAQEPLSYSVATQLPVPYPGIGNSSYAPTYAPNYMPATPTQIAPAPSSGPLGKLASFFGGGASGAGQGSGSGTGSLNIAQIKQVIDRLGGVDGIMETMGKVQKMVQSVQQMAPLVKVLMGSFGKKKKKSNSDSDGLAPRRRRRRRRKTTGTKGIGKSSVKRPASR